MVPWVAYWIRCWLGCRVAGLGATAPWASVQRRVLHQTAGLNAFRHDLGRTLKSLTRLLHGRPVFALASETRRCPRWDVWATSPQFADPFGPVRRLSPRAARTGRPETG